MTKTYETADYYDCKGGEEFTHHTPEEAIEDYFNSFLDPRESLRNVIGETCPLTVYAYERDAVAPGWIDAHVADLVDDMNDRWKNEYGDPDGEGFEPKALEYLKEEFKTAVNVVIAQHTVWSCSFLESRDYSADEVLGIVNNGR